MYIVVWSLKEDPISHHNEVSFTTFHPAIDIDIGQDHEIQYYEVKVGVSLSPSLPSILIHNNPMW